MGSRPQDILEWKSCASKTIEGTAKEQRLILCDYSNSASKKTVQGNFKPKDGIYTVSLDGFYLISIRPILKTEITAEKNESEASLGFLYLVIRNKQSDEETFHDISVKGGTGHLKHLRRGDEICVERSSISAVLAVVLSVELTMRKIKKRKRRYDIHAGNLTRKQKRTLEKQEKEETKRRLELGFSSGTGSDTEWEEAFSSDSDDKLERRRVTRRLKRKMKL